MYALPKSSVCIKWGRESRSPDHQTADRPKGGLRCGCRKPVSTPAPRRATQTIRFRLAAPIPRHPTRELPTVRPLGNIALSINRQIPPIDSFDDDLQEIAAILAAGYLRHRKLEQREPRLDNSVPSSPHGRAVRRRRDRGQRGRNGGQPSHESRDLESVGRGPVSRLQIDASLWVTTGSSLA